MATYDLVVKNGIVIDGIGAGPAPGRRHRARTA